MLKDVINCPGQADSVDRWQVFSSVDRWQRFSPGQKGSADWHWPGRLMEKLLRVLTFSCFLIYVSISQSSSLSKWSGVVLPWLQLPLSQQPLWRTPLLAVFQPSWQMDVKDLLQELNTCRAVGQRIRGRRRSVKLVGKIDFRCVRVTVSWLGGEVMGV